MDLEESNLTAKGILPAPAVLPWREFADWIRMADEHNTVWGWVRNGHLPSHQVGKHAMVNLARQRADLEKGKTELKAGGCSHV